MKYGLGFRVDQDDPLCVMTCAEVGAVLGISAQRVHKIEQQALDKLRMSAAFLSEAMS